MNTAKAISNDNRMKGYVVRLRGLPYSSTASDVVKFFDQVEMCRGLDGVVFTYMPDGRPTGEAFVEFPSEEAQREAMKKHKNLVGTRYIELFVSTKSDMLQAIQQNKYLLGYANRRRWVPNNMPMQGHMGYNHDMRGAPMHQHGHMQFAPGGMEDMNELFRGELPHATPNSQQPVEVLWTGMTIAARLCARSVRAACMLCPACDRSVRLSPPKRRLLMSPPCLCPPWCLQAST